MNARPHPDPLPQERANHAPASGGEALSVRRTPRGSAGSCLMDARPHPGPLPQERVNHAPASGGAEPRERPMSLHARSERSVAAMSASNLSRRLRPPLPLPGGEGRGEGEPFSLHSKSQTAGQAAARRKCSCDTAGFPFSPGVRAGAPLTSSFIRAPRPSVLRQRPWRTALEFAEDFITDHLCFTSKERVPESEHLDSERGEIFLAFLVPLTALWKSVLRSIEFNREPRFIAEKIEGVFPEWTLASELVAVETPGAQPTPH